MNSFLQGPVTKPSPLLESNPCEDEMEDQMESTQVVGIKQEKLELRNMDVPSSSMENDEGKIDMSDDKEPPCCSLAPGESRSSLTGEESCRDAIMVSYFAPIDLLSL